MREVSLGTLPVVIPDGRICGASVYKGVIIFWDEDFDNRVFIAVDDIQRDYSDSHSLLGAAEHEGSLSLWWEGESPAFREMEIDERGGCDVWNVTHFVNNKEIE